MELDEYLKERYPHLSDMEWFSNMLCSAFARHSIRQRFSFNTLPRLVKRYRVKRAVNNKAIKNLYLVRGIILCQHLSKI